MTFKGRVIYEHGTSGEFLLHWLKKVAAAVFVLASGCVEYSGQAGQLRASCSKGHQSACIDYEEMVASCSRPPRSLIPILGCTGIGPATVFHPSGTMDTD